MADPEQRSKEHARLEMPLWFSAEGLLHVVVVVAIVACRGVKSRGSKSCVGWSRSNKMFPSPFRIWELS